MPSDPTLTDDSTLAVLAERIGYLFAKLHHRWLNESVSALRRAGLGLSGLHFAALSVVEAVGPISQGELGEYVKKDRSSMVAIVDALEAEGLVERRRNPADRRAYALEVTDGGRQWLAQARLVLRAADDRMLSALDPGERDLLVGMLQRLLFTAPPTA